MVKVASTVAIGALSLPLLASALPRPIVENDARVLTIDVRELEGLDDLDARGFWQNVKSDAKKVGHEIKEVATSPVGKFAAKTAMTALLLRDPELYAELDARGFWKDLKKDEKKFRHEFQELTARPGGRRAARTAMASLAARDPEFDSELEARGKLWKEVKQDEKKFRHELKELSARPGGRRAARTAMTSLAARDLEYDSELEARGKFWKEVKQDERKIRHEMKELASRPGGQRAAKTAMAIVARNPEFFDYLEARGFWKSVKQDAKKFGHELKEVATSPLGKAAAKTAMKALLARDPEMLEELAARDGGFWQNVKNGAEKAGHKVEDFLNSPFVSTVSSVVLQHGLEHYSSSKEPAAKPTTAPAEPVKERDFDDLDELYARGEVWNTVKDDVKKGVQKVQDFLSSPIGATIGTIGVQQGIGYLTKGSGSKTPEPEHVVAKPPTEPAPVKPKPVIKERDLEGLEEFDARGFWKTVGDDAKKVGQKVENFANSPVGQIVTQVGLTAAKDAIKFARDVEFEEFDARDLMDERFFNDELDGMYTRDFEINELD